MKKEKSCGFVLFTILDNEIKYLLVKSIFDSIGFAKGHVEVNETEIETAFREVKEEVNITPKLIDGFREENNYQLEDLNIDKTVVYFLGEFDHQNIVCQESEIKETMLLNYLDAYNILQVERLKNILKKANYYLLNKYKKSC